MDKENENEIESNEDEEEADEEEGREEEKDRKNQEEDNITDFSPETLSTGVKIFSFSDYKKKESPPSEKKRMN